MIESFRSAMPVLPSLDLAKTERVYGALGFAATVKAPETLIVRRDSVELMFWLCHDRGLCEASGAYLRVEGVDRLQAEARAAGWRATLPKDQPWGQRESYLFDPHGNLLRLGQPST